jgi:Ala-tRNA(Pro) deacylase
LALLNLSASQKGEVTFHLDNAIKSEYVAIHPMENTSTVWIKQSDLVSLLEKNGIKTHTLDMTEVPQEEKKSREERGSQKRSQSQS